MTSDVVTSDERKRLETWLLQNTKPLSERGFRLIREINGIKDLLYILCMYFLLNGSGLIQKILKIQ